MREQHTAHCNEAVERTTRASVLMPSYLLLCLFHSSLKEGFAFVEFENERDAIEAVRGRDGSDFNGQRIRVEHSRPRTGPGGPMGAMGGRGMDARGPPKCFNCGQEGHMARDCKSGDWSNRCYVCKGEGHKSNSCPQRGGGVGLAGAGAPAPAATAGSSSGNDDRRRSSRSRSPRRRSRSRSRERDAGAQQGGDNQQQEQAESAPAQSAE